MTRHSPAARPWRGEPPAPELDATDDPLVLDDGAGARRAGQLAHAHVVAVVGRTEVRLLRVEVADARGRVGQLAGELAGRGRVRGEPAEEVDRDAERLGGGRQVGDRQVGAAVLDHRDQRARVIGVGGKLELRETPHFPGLQESFSYDANDTRTDDTKDPEPARRAEAVAAHAGRDARRQPDEAESHPQRPPFAADRVRGAGEDGARPAGAGRARRGRGAARVLKGAA